MLLMALLRLGSRKGGMPLSVVVSGEEGREKETFRWGCGVRLRGGLRGGRAFELWVFGFVLGNWRISQGRWFFGSVV